jgi:quaternary ammonium compound-resistance protein SugE
VNAWGLLAAAAVFEIVFAMGMKLSEGFTRLWPSVAVGVGAVGGLWLLTLSMKTLPVSVAYPAWTALGTLGTVTLGWLMLGESLSPLKLASAAAIVAGVAGLRASA